jgi:CheY-like chemotaxis protein
MVHGKIMKIMIVDDNAEMRELIRTILAEAASEFVECADGREAVAVYEAERPDWTVMDVAMGVMDGLTATRLLTARYPEAQIMMITQHDSPALRERSREAGAAGFLSKENLIELRSALRRISDHDGSQPNTDAS